MKHGKSLIKTEWIQKFTLRKKKLLDGIINNCAIGNDELVLIIILKY